MHTEDLYCWEERPFYHLHSSQMGSVGGELVYVMNYHIQPKSADLNHVLFVLVHLL